MERSSGKNGPASWTARVLAPLALVTIALVVVIVVSGALDGSEESGGRPERQARTPGCTPSEEGRRDLDNGYAVLDAGENLTTVAEATCKSPERLIELNPNLDPQLLPVSGCVDLRPDGCKAAG